MVIHFAARASIGLTHSTEDAWKPSTGFPRFTHVYIASTWFTWIPSSSEKESSCDKLESRLTSFDRG